MRIQQRLRRMRLLPFAKGIFQKAKSLVKPVRSASQTIHEAVLTWPNVTSSPHRFGGVEYRLGRREIGHIHGNYLVDIPFPRKVRDELVAAGWADAHHILPESGWVSFYIQKEADVEQAIALLRYSFDLATKQRG